MTLSEAIAIVIGKRAAGIPITGAKEELVDKFIAEWAASFGVSSTK